MIHTKKFRGKRRIYRKQQSYRHFFALMNEPCITYKGKDATICSHSAEILLADYDGQGAIFITNQDVKENNDA